MAHKRVTFTNGQAGILDLNAVKVIREFGNSRGVFFSGPFVPTSGNTANYVEVRDSFQSLLQAYNL